MILDKLLSNLSVHVKPFAICSISKGWRLHLPGPPALLLHFTMEGSGTLYGPNGDAHPISPMHLSIVPIGAKHTLESTGPFTDELRIDAPPPGEQVCEIVAGSGDDAELVVACGLVNVSYGPSLDIFDHLHEVLSVDLSEVPEALTAFKGILHEQSNVLAGSEAMTAALMTQCLVHFFRLIQKQGKNVLPWLVAIQDERLSKVIDMVLERPGDEYTVESLAETVAMSRSAFTSHFTASFGSSPMSLVNHIRMQHAAQLLTMENKSIDEISRAVGYSSRSHFSRAFKEHSGFSPRDFRTEHSSNQTSQLH